MCLFYHTPRRLRREQCAVDRLVVNQSRYKLLHGYVHIVCLDKSFGWRIDDRVPQYVGKQNEDNERPRYTSIDWSLSKEEITYINRIYVLKVMRTRLGVSAFIFL